MFRRLFILSVLVFGCHQESFAFSSQKSTATNSPIIDNIKNEGIYYNNTINKFINEIENIFKKLYIFLKEKRINHNKNQDVINTIIYYDEYFQKTILKRIGENILSTDDIKSALTDLYTKNRIFEYKSKIVNTTWKKLIESALEPLSNIMLKSDYIKLSKLPLVNLNQAFEFIDDPFGYELQTADISDEFDNNDAEYEYELQISDISDKFDNNDFIMDEDGIQIEDDINQIIENIKESKNEFDNQKNNIQNINNNKKSKQGNIQKNKIIYKKPLEQKGKNIHKNNITNTTKDYREELKKLEQEIINVIYYLLYSAEFASEEEKINYIANCSNAFNKIIFDLIVNYKLSKQFLKKTLCILYSKSMPIELYKYSYEQWLQMLYFENIELYHLWVFNLKKAFECIDYIIDYIYKCSKNTKYK